MKLAYHLYQLKSAAPLGALSLGTVRQGALLRVQLAAGVTGYADLHPWAELGDLPLAEQLDRLVRGETTEQTQASLAFATIDAHARAAGRSLWDGLTVPPSHFLLSGIADSSHDALEAALAEGFTHFKIKVGKNLDAEKRGLRDLGSFLQGVPLGGGGLPRLRLDYNETLTPSQFVGYFSHMDFLLPFLDFIEDPFPFVASEWADMSERFQINFAVDRAVSEAAGAGFEGVIIHKPARAGTVLPPGISERLPQRLVVTSYLDHPFGQLCAAWVAAQLPQPERGETHGLVSHRIYARTRFSDSLGWIGPHLQLPEGHGFGFDDELAQTEWRILT